MSVQRLLRFFLGLIIAVVLLFFILPMVGVPSSHFLPPSTVYRTADGETRGIVTGKYMEGSDNAFDIGSNNYFVNYEFKAHVPSANASLPPGPVQIYQGTAHIDEDSYNQFSSDQSQQNINNPTPDQVISLPPDPIRVKYSKSNPDISGIDETWALTFQQGRNIGPGSNTLGMWMIWIVVAIVLAFFISMLLSKVMKSEDI